MPQESNFSTFHAQNATNPYIYVQGKACFLFDINFNSTQYLYVAHILTSIVNAAFSPMAIAGNAVVIFTVVKTPSLHSPSNVFICCLAVSDFTVGLLAQPLFVVHKVGEILHRFEMYCTTRMLLESIGNITTGASVLTMAGATIERSLALYLHLRYNELVTVRRVLLAAASFWIFLIALVVLRVFFIRPDVYNTISVTIISSCLLSTYLAYTKIWRCVRQHERRIDVHTMSTQIEGNVDNSRSVLHYKKSTIAMISVVGVFTACFLPLMCVSIAHRVRGYTIPVRTAYLVVSTIAFLNSSVNPFVYFWRMKALRQAMKTVVKKRLCRKVF